MLVHGKVRHAVLALAAIAAVLGMPLSAGSGMAAAADGGYTVLRLPLGQYAQEVAVNPSTNTVYFGDNPQDLNAPDLSVVNGATGLVTTTTNVGEPVRSIAVDPATDTIYVGAADNIDVINGATNKITDTIAEPEFSYPNGVAVDSATNTVYVANSGPSGQDIVVIDGATNTIEKTISTGPGTGPSGIAVDESTDDIWVSEEENGNVIEIDGATNKIIHTVPAGNVGAFSVAVNAASDTVYALDTEDGALAVIDGATATVTKDIPVGSTSLAGVAVDQSSGTVYVLPYLIGSPGTTTVIDGTTNKVIAALPRGGLGVAVNQATGTAYEAADWGGDAWVINASATNALSPVITTLAGVWLNEGQNNSETYVASAIPTATFTQTGALPKGVTLSPSGLLTGIPAAGTGGVYPVTLTASNGVGVADSELVYVSVAQSPAFTSAAAAAFIVGHPGSFALQATGYPSPAFSTTATLPSGLAINSTASGWQLSGTPAVGTGGVYEFTLIAANNIGSNARQRFTLTIREAPRFTSAPHVTFRAGTRSKYLIQADGYPAARFTETGRLPHGVTLDPAGRLAGTPGIHTGGVYRLTITARNGAGAPVRQAFTLTVDQAPAIVSARHATFRAGRENTFTVRATGFPVVRLSKLGSLPSGVRFVARHNGTAVLKGKPSPADIGRTFVFIIVANNGVGAGARQKFKLKILEP